LNQRGHLGLPDGVPAVRQVLEEIFAALGGDVLAQARKRATPLAGDFLHEPTGTLIEIDEHQHFTSYRLLTLDHYPDGVPLGFDLDEYRGLCHRWASKADGYFRTKAATGFGPSGRQRQRAYDALRDLAAPAIGLPPVIRVAGPDRNGSAAYGRVRGMLRSRLA
jgi:hypothetical protein